ncbi:hypothetical protein LX81_01554 [Palleronia aestuarii]|uniref:DDE family transposase n=1 Tax=Palleronia aestuarii TaxID=568105 RepID=A0A2W7NJP0_9RHOB|nr:hypothetical protein LX81_01554 [Palleronia aestuarii]
MARLQAWRPQTAYWRRIHLGIGEETPEIRTVDSSLVLTTGLKEPMDGSHIGDAPVLPDLLGQIPQNQQIGSFTFDGAYDPRKCHHAIIPPRRNAKP